MRFDEHFVKRAVPGVSIVCGNVPNDPHFVIDSRKVKSGDIFVALPGMRCDGHDFVSQAIERGAAGLLIAEHKKNLLHQLDSRYRDVFVMVVKDTLQALADLATAWRARFDYPVIAITGSVGKTLTKQMLANMLELQGGNYLVSHGNQNTKIGVSLNMLRMRAEHAVAIFEVGVNRRGEMGQLAHMIRPTTAVITNIGHSHMEGLGSLYDIALEKRDVFKYFSEGSIGIINGDQAILSNVSYQHPVVKFGVKTTNQIQARKVRIAGSHISFVLKIYQEKYPVVIKQAHAGSVANALAAASVAHLLAVPHATIVKAIQMPVVIAGRFEQRKLSHVQGFMINDCYNANPESMKAALLAFQRIETKAKKIAVLGDMLELGVNSPFWHRQIGRFLRKVPSLKQVILVGNLVQWTKKTIPAGVPVTIVDSWQEAVKHLREQLAHEESAILVKGSRAMGLNNLVDTFTNNAISSEAVQK